MFQEDYTDDGLVLGRLVDELESEEDQVEQDQQNLYDYDMGMFVRLLDSRMSEAVVIDYLDQFKEENEIFWETVLKKIIKVYDLNNLKFYLSEVKIFGFIEYVSELVYDLKVRIPYSITECNLKQDITRDYFEDYLVAELYSKLLIWAVKFIDRDSYKRFVNQIFNEAKTPEVDIPED